MNAETNINGKSRKKRTTGIITAVLAILILLSGTFAWYYVTNAINEFGGKRDDFIGNSAVLHDDFDETGIDGVHNKDVYVENTGNNSIFVRIRLDEYMEKDEISLIAGADKWDEDTWKTHIPNSKSEECEEDFHDYWEWKLGGGTEYVPNPKGIQGVISSYDKDGNNTLKPGAVGNRETLREDPSDPLSNFTTVITMAEYNKLTAAEKNTFYGWVYDTDGYAYWSQKLLPNEATGLLLDQVSLLVQFGEEEDYYYAINVVMETVDEDDLNAWLTNADTIDGAKTDEATKDGKDLLKGMSDQYTRITDDMNEEVPPAKNYDKDGDGFLDEEELEEWLEELDGIVKGEDNKYYRPRPDLDGKGGKGDIYEEVDKNGKPVDPERIIDSSDDNKPGTPDDEEWTKITDEMNNEEPPARDYDENNKGYLTPDEKEAWEKAVEEETERQKSTPLSLSATTNGTKFKEGVVLKAEDMEVVVTFEDDSTRTLSAGEFDWTPKTALSVGDNKVEVSYTVTPTAAKYTDAVQPITVKGEMTVVAEAKVLESITITEQPTKKDYKEGEKFDAEGMVVQANYDNDTNNPNVTGYKCTPEEALTTDVTSITVSYTENGITKTATVNGITVTSSQTEEQKEIEQAEGGETVTIDGIEWFVLSKNDTKGEAELISKKEVATGTYYDNFTASWKWSESRIYKWLNEDWYNGLSQDFKDMIVETTKETNLPQYALTTNGDETTSNVYLLSHSEYETYNSKYGTRLYGTGSSAIWWLRTPTPSTPNNSVYCVLLSSGNRSTNAVNKSNGIRPVLTVKYK